VTGDWEGEYLQLAVAGMEYYFDLSMRERWHICTPQWDARFRRWWGCPKDVVAPGGCLGSATDLNVATHLAASLTSISVRSSRLQ
jgi:hypothetical protein